MKKIVCLSVSLLMALSMLAACAPAPAEAPAQEPVAAPAAEAPAAEAPAAEAPAAEAPATEEPAAEEPVAEPAAESEPVTATFVQTTGGTVMGYRYDGVDNYFAIQYGKAERFQAPEANSWEGVRVCNVMGEVCPQSMLKTAARDLFNCMDYNLLQVANEANCLQLNVWTPESSTAAARPVVVWLHGGGFSTGSSTQFNFYLGETFAKDQDAVFVSVNHRLNCLGYLDLSAYGDEYKYSGNAGMLDIVLALQWVKDNIAAFGGDAGNVTIIGQSGGGSKVTTLMGMPSAAGLFHRAAALSGGSVQVTRTTEQAQGETAKLVESLGLTGKSNEEIVTALTTMDYDALYAACEAAGISRSYGPVVDGDLYPDGTFAMSKDIPFMCGNVLGEFSTNYSNVCFCPSEEVYNATNLSNMSEDEIKAAYIAKFGEESGEKIMAAFIEAYPGHNAAEGMYINNRKGFMSALSMADAMVGYGGTVYNYVAAYSYTMYGGIVPIHTASDVPFWFANVDDITAWVAGDEATARLVNDNMSGALAAFARTGNPSQNDLAWDSYTPDNGACMVFDRESGVRGHHDSALCDLIAAATAGGGFPF